MKYTATHAACSCLYAFVWSSAVHSRVLFRYSGSRGPAKVPANAHGREEYACKRGNWEGAKAAYRSVDNAIPSQARVLVQPMMRLSEGDARAAACDGAGINGREALEEGGGPGCCAGGVGEARGVLGDVGGASDPLVEIGLHGCLVWGGHCIGCGWK